MPDKLVVRPPPKRIGADWTHEQWFLKALELADVFTATQKLPDPNFIWAPDLRKPPTCAAPEPPAAYKPNRHQSPAPASRITRVVDGVEEGLISAIEREGFEVIPDWYGALDRIYALTDMARVSQKPEPFVGDGSRAGAPGYSYLVKSSAVSNSVFSPEEEEARAKAHEALMQRYQNRLLVTSLR